MNDISRNHHNPQACSTRLTAHDGNQKSLNWPQSKGLKNP